MPEVNEDGTEKKVEGEGEQSSEADTASKEGGENAGTGTSEKSEGEGEAKTE